MRKWRCPEAAERDNEVMSENGNSYSGLMELVLESRLCLVAENVHMYIHTQPSCWCLHVMDTHPSSRTHYYSQTTWVCSVAAEMWSFMKGYRPECSSLLTFCDFYQSELIEVHLQWLQLTRLIAVVRCIVQNPYCAGRDKQYHAEVLWESEL